jgi:hypothetical protein
MVENCVIQCSNTVSWLLASFFGSAQSTTTAEVTGVKSSKMARGNKAKKKYTPKADKIT